MGVGKVVEQGGDGRESRWGEWEIGIAGIVGEDGRSGGNCGWGVKVRKRMGSLELNMRLHIIQQRLVPFAEPQRARARALQPSKERRLTSECRTIN